MQYDQCTLDEVASALCRIPSDDRDVWIQMGMAIKSEFGDDGFDTWDDWSQTADSYKNDAARASWKSFKSGGGITMATLFKKARDNGWEPEKKELTEEEKLELGRQRAAHREKREAEAKREAELEKRWRVAIAQAAVDIWALLKPVGNSPYLGHKKIASCGAGFVPHGIIIEYVDDSVSVNLITGRGAISAFFDMEEKPNSFLYLKPGCLVVPMFDGQGRLGNLQVIFHSEKTGFTKKFLKHGPVSGMSYLMGTISHGGPILIAEGFATAASIHMATQSPVVVAWNCNNLIHIARQYRAVYPEHQIVIAADDDQATGGNPGVKAATKAAKAVGGHVWLPEMVEQGQAA